ncbi:hypothetical protein Pyn_37059 [Prunus yedoensis var. nudiflora]|uniref:Uncharacterized protein n=1 Tax=Prunus yedoensis var. nudiflora TaxID=2094558 RepID=A0A314V1I1_PRUYE|nr:hypothetical protein Pyn_37059 [Prunus yedoensis var. nudiflora]
MARSAFGARVGWARVAKVERWALDGLRQGLWSQVSKLGFGEAFRASPRVPKLELWRIGRELGVGCSSARRRCRSARDIRTWPLPSATELGSGGAAWRWVWEPDFLKFANVVSARVTWHCGSREPSARVELGFGKSRSWVSRVETFGVKDRSWATGFVRFGGFDLGPVKLGPCEKIVEYFVKVLWQVFCEALPHGLVRQSPWSWVKRVGAGCIRTGLLRGWAPSLCFGAGPSSVVEVSAIVSRDLSTLSWQGS